jgi:hypothetical protein
MFRCVMAVRAHPALASSLRRMVAAGGAALVLALALLGASPVAHHWLHTEAGVCTGGHGHEHHHKGTTGEDPGCAVVLFAAGVTLPVTAPALLPPCAVPVGVSPVIAADVYLIAPRYLRQPERGPPELG